MNHFMLGHLMEWHFAYVAGIRQAPGSAGWKKIIIAPNPGGLSSASATFHSPSGRIAVRWRQGGGKFEMTVRVPPGVVAVAILPDGEQHHLQPGKQARFAVKM
jgi:hypothetical protein